MLLKDRGAGISVPIAAADKAWWLYGHCYEDLGSRGLASKC